ncbi:lyase [Lithospermum erythrorhizon]|uniref:Lyase n=1 Tax=Lithospermum erythrorhizon TaxID=34254 RepID=A0AAV3NQE0_LITER
MERFLKCCLNLQGIHILVIVLGVISIGGVVECRKARLLERLEYSAISCRTHSASITEFGGVGDGETLNTKAFQEAVNSLSQYASDGGAQLYVPAGKWLTGSFNLTSHFTLYLHKDAVLLASQVVIARESSCTFFSRLL